MRNLKKNRRTNSYLLSLENPNQPLNKAMRKLNDSKEAKAKH